MLCHGFCTLRLHQNDYIVNYLFLISLCSQHYIRIPFDIAIPTCNSLYKKRLRPSEHRRSPSLVDLKATPLFDFKLHVQQCAQSALSGTDLACSSPIHITHTSCETSAIIKQGHCITHLMYFRPDHIEPNSWSKNLQFTHKHNFCRTQTRAQQTWNKHHSTLARPYVWQIRLPCSEPCFRYLLTQGCSHSANAMTRRLWRGTTDLSWSCR